MSSSSTRGNIRFSQVYLMLNSIPSSISASLSTSSGLSAVTKEVGDKVIDFRV